MQMDALLLIGQEQPRRFLIGKGHLCENIVDIGTSLGGTKVMTKGKGGGTVM